MYQIAIFFLIFLFTFQVKAQDKELPSPILFILDASGSMWGQLQGKTKKEIAADVLSTTVNNLPDNQNVGLIVYGHRIKGDCNDIEFLADLKNNSKDKITKAVNEINPIGRTPLARSATLAINSLRDSKTKATIILITDGIESCDGNICDVVSKAKAEGVDFKLHIVGFGLKDSETEQLNCAAKAGDGHYYDAADAGGLSEGLTEATTETIDEAEVNFSVYAIKNGEPVDAVVKAYDNVGKRQPITLRTYKDTAYAFLPPSTYKLNVKPLEGSDVDAIIIEGLQSFEDTIVHQTLKFDGSKVNVTATNNGEGWDATVIIHNKATGKRTSQTRTYGKTQTMEVNPGTYDIKIKALTMNGLETEFIMKNVEVKAEETTKVEHNFKSGIANLGVSENGTLIDCTVSIIDPATEKPITGARSYTSANSNPRPFILNPGNYKVKLRGEKNGKDTIKEFSITVKERESFTKMYEW